MRKKNQNKQTNKVNVLVNNVSVDDAVVMTSIGTTSQGASKHKLKKKTFPFTWRSNDALLSLR